MIGRSYAAAIERRKNVVEKSDDFYEKTVVDIIMNSKLDEWLASLPTQLTDPWTQLADVITVHKRLMDLYSRMTGLDKRSLASKYLHFHKPELFFLYDSRAKAGLAKITPSIKMIPSITTSDADIEYMTHSRRCQWVIDDVKHKYHIILTPRQVDKMLLRITDKILKRGHLS